MLEASKAQDPTNQFTESGVICTLTYKRLAAYLILPSIPLDKYEVVTHVGEVSQWHCLSGDTVLNHTGDCTKSGGSCSRGYQVEPKPDVEELGETRGSFSVLDGSGIKPRREVNNDVPRRFSSIITTPSSIILPSSCRLNRESPRAMSGKEGRGGGGGLFLV